MDQHLRCGLENINIETFQSADALRKLNSRLDFALGNDTWIEDHSLIFGILYYWDIYKCTQLLVAHLPEQTRLDFEPVHHADSESHRIYSEINTGDRWWDTQDLLPAAVMIVTVICACTKTHLTNFSGNQHAWPVCLTISNIRTDICRTPKKLPWIPVALIPWPPKVAKNNDETGHSAVRTVLSPLQNLDITGPGLNWDCADGFQRHCYSVLASWVGDYLEQVMVAQVSYGSFPMCEIPKGWPMGNPTC